MCPPRRQHTGTVYIMRLLPDALPGVGTKMTSGANKGKLVNPTLDEQRHEIELELKAALAVEADGLKRVDTLVDKGEPIPASLREYQKSRELHAHVKKYHVDADPQITYGYSPVDDYLASTVSRARFR